MGNAINFWEIQAEVWATGKYLTAVNDLNEEDLNKHVTIDDLLVDTNKALLNDNTNMNSETCFSTAQTTSSFNFKQSIDNLCIESA